MEKTLNSRIINKHDIEANWLKAANFIPKQGELIVYDIDESHDYERLKMGDGVNNVNDLPFIISAITSERITEICGIAPMLTFSVDENGDALMNAGWPDDNGNIQI